MLTTHAPLNWSQILEFVHERMPDASAKIRGADPAELAALQRRSRVALPENYVGFLRHFGGNDGGFRVFPRHDYLAAELLSGPPPRWDPERYLLIGIMSDKVCEVPFDLHLDLSRADTVDAPLVSLPPSRDDEDDDEDDDEAELLPDPIAPSLADRLILHITWRCANQNKKAKVRLDAFFPHSPSEHEVSTRYRELVAAAEQLGFAPCVSATANTWVGRRDGETFVRIHTARENALVVMDVRGDDAVAVAQVREVVEDLGLGKPARILGD